MSVHGSYPPLLLLIIELPGIFSMTNSDRRNMSSPYQNFIDQIEIHSLTSSSAVHKTTLSELPQVVGRPLYPRFPIFESRDFYPPCRSCGRVSLHQRNVGMNRKNNYGRPFYLCIGCLSNEPYGKRIKGGNRWITWDDDVGMHPTNLRCNCGIASRQDRSGPDTTYPGMGFWTCASGQCEYYSVLRSGKMWDEVEGTDIAFENLFQPWLL